MSTLIRTEDSAHWYEPSTGKPMHRVVGKNGKEKNTTIREARELGLFPSSTSILKLWPKAQLQNWILEQGILAALTLPRNEGEELQSFAKRVVEDSQAQAKAAAEFGTKVHNGIAGDRIDDLSVVPFVNTWHTWRAANVQKEIWHEKVIINKSVGYAGRADALLQIKDELVLVDFKCRMIKDRNKPPLYETDLMQLLSYAKPECVNHVASIIIDSQTPSEPIFHLWPQEDYDYHWKCFLACKNLWSHVNNYGI